MNIEETISTLDYAYRAKNIKNQPTGMCSYACTYTRACLIMSPHVILSYQITSSTLNDTIASLVNLVTKKMTLSCFSDEVDALRAQLLQTRAKNGYINAANIPCCNDCMKKRFFSTAQCAIFSTSKFSKLSTS